MYFQSEFHLLGGKKLKHTYKLTEKNLLLVNKLKGSRLETVLK